MGRVGPGGRRVGEIRFEGVVDEPGLVALEKDAGVGHRWAQATRTAGMPPARSGKLARMTQLPDESLFGDYGEWPGRDVLDSGGERLGGVREIYLDRETGQPEWVLVDVDGGEARFVPLADAAVESTTDPRRARRDRDPRRARHRRRAAHRPVRGAPAVRPLRARLLRGRLRQRPADRRAADRGAADGLGRPTPTRPARPTRPTARPRGATSRRRTPTTRRRRPSRRRRSRSSGPTSRSRRR